MLLSLGLKSKYNITHTKKSGTGSEKSRSSKGIHSRPNTTGPMFSPFPNLCKVLIPFSLPPLSKFNHRRVLLPVRRGLWEQVFVEVNRKEIISRRDQLHIQITTPLSTPLPSGGESGCVCQSQTSQDSVNRTLPQSLGYLSLLHSLKLQIQIGPSRPQWCPVVGKKRFVHISIH